MNGIMSKVTQPWLIDEEVNKAVMSFILLGYGNQTYRYTVVMRALRLDDFTHRDNIVCNDESIVPIPKGYYAFILEDQVPWVSSFMSDKALLTEVLEDWPCALVVRDCIAMMMKGWEGWEIWHEKHA